MNGRATLQVRRASILVEVIYGPCLAASRGYSEAATLHVMKIERGCNDTLLLGLPSLPDRC